MGLVMGAYLDRPIKEKEQESGNNEWLQYAMTSMQGWRVNQEDAHNCVIDFMENCALFAVYDGHGGPEVSKYLAENFPNYLKKNICPEKDIAEELKKAFIQFDAILCQNDVVNVLDKLKAKDAKEENGVVGNEADEEKAARRRDKMYKEITSLSEEADMDLSTLIQQYRFYKKTMKEKLDLKRTSSESMDQYSKRPRIVNESSTEEKSPSKDQSAEIDSSVPDEPLAESCNRNGEVALQGKSLTNRQPITNGCSARDFDLISTEEPALKILKSDLSSEPSESEISCKSMTESQCDQTTDSDKKEDSPSLNDSGTGHSSVSSTTTTAGAIEFSDQPQSSKNIDLDADSSTDQEDDDYTPGDESKTDIDDEEQDDEECVDDEEEEEVGDEEILVTDEEEAEIEQVLVGGGENKAGYDSGSTACLALLFKDRIVVANAGDSRSVLSRGGEALDLSFDHKPEDLGEKQRIIRAGGTVSGDGRVNGGLNLSRAFGDHFYKQKADIPLEEQMITALPDVMEVKLTDEDQFLLIACDGIWNSMSSQAAINFIRDRIGTKPLVDIGAELCENCCASDTTGDGTGCDNMTVIIVDLQNKRRELNGQASHSDSTEH